MGGISCILPESRSNILADMPDICYEAGVKDSLET